MKPRAEVVQGDALTEMRRLIERGVKVGLCLVDPPQQITAAAWDTMIALKPMWNCLKQLVMPDRARVVLANEPYASLLVASNLPMYRHEWIWSKNRASNFLNANFQPLKEHEPIKVFSQKKCLYKPEKTDGHAPVNFARRKANSSNLYNFHNEATNNAGATDRYPRSILYFDSVDNCSPERFHENQKPVDLLRYLIRTYSNEGDTVLDFTAGSFSTGVACMIENRNFIGIEQDGYFCEVGRARISRAQGIACDIPKRERPHKPTPLFDEQVA
jgi:site-specific DNA-methyltransferase (adenine-specific)